MRDRSQRRGRDAVAAERRGDCSGCGGAGAGQPAAAYAGRARSGRAADGLLSARSLGGRHCGGPDRHRSRSVDRQRADRDRRSADAGGGRVPRRNPGTVAARAVAAGACRPAGAAGVAREAGGDAVGARPPCADPRRSDRLARRGGRAAPGHAADVGRGGCGDAGAVPAACAAVLGRASASAGALDRGEDRCAGRGGAVALRRGADRRGRGGGRWRLADLATAGQRGNRNHVSAADRQLHRAAGGSAAIRGAAAAAADRCGAGTSRQFAHRAGRRPPVAGDPCRRDGR